MRLGVGRMGRAKDDQQMVELEWKGRGRFVGWRGLRVGVAREKVKG